MWRRASWSFPRRTASSCSGARRAGPPGRWTGTVPGGGLLTSGLEGRSETTRFRGCSISQVWEPEVFPQKPLFSLCCAVSPSCWPGRRKHPPHALSVASVLGPALGLVLLCSPRGGATRLPVSRTEVQPKYSSKGQSSFSFHLELCDGAGSCREALFSCPNNPSAAEVSQPTLRVLPLGGRGGIRCLSCKQMFLTQS